MGLITMVNMDCLSICSSCYHCCYDDGNADHDYSCCHNSECYYTTTLWTGAVVMMVVMLIMIIVVAITVNVITQQYCGQELL